VCVCVYLTRSRAHENGQLIKDAGQRNAACRGDKRRTPSQHTLLKRDARARAYIINKISSAFYILYFFKYYFRFFFLSLMNGRESNGSAERRNLFITPTTTTTTTTVYMCVCVCVTDVLLSLLHTYVYTNRGRMKT